MFLQKLELDLSGTGIPKEKIEAYKEALTAGEKRLASGEEAFGGWYRLPLSYGVADLEAIKKAAKEIQESCQVLVVIGIGGSYLGAKAAIDFLGGSREGAPEILFAGNSISSAYHKDLMEQIADKDICLCVISKSGTTTEPSIAFALLKDLLQKKYGREEASKRIYAVTDKEKGVLREEADREGYTSFVVPDDIGGRYSVLTPVGLLPIAAAGVDIEKMLGGALSELMEWTGGKSGVMADPGLAYAAARNDMYQQGKTVEVFECFEPRLRFFVEWLKQLFGESEGKNGKGIFPAGLQFSTDLHSMGQFLQEGNQIFFETVLDLLDPGTDLTVPESAGGFLAGKSMNEVNRAALEGTVNAHRKAGIPVIRLGIPAADEFSFGKLVQFFERSCALSGFLLGVDPFNQPGVEQYKAEMRAILAK